ncbi:M24 family metallopeptidase [Flintibacter muris]|uniref:M24 family metallopeptidase n=1 Tax=Flintibacter muris TaxID=2941327 RepID=UPI00203FE850|nr:aminopeptidase P family protein [Flintibacter muris]
MNHIEKISAQLPEYGLDAMLITSESGERYALGFHGEGLLLVTRSGAQYSTDGRYIEAAREQIQGAEIVLTTPEKGHMAFAKEYIEGEKLHNIGFESGAMTVDSHRKYTQELPGILTPAQKLLDGLRAAKDEGELALMRRAQEITDEAFRAILNFIRPGMTEREIAARLVYELLSRGGDKVSFDPIVAAGANGSRPHAVPGDQVVDMGMFITMDFGCKVEGYCSDMTRTVALGHPTAEMEEVYAAVLAAQKAGINAARAGVTGREIDAAARRVLQEAGYGDYFSHSFGHSLGVDIHESPNASSKETRPMPVGAVISAEPGVYIPGRLGVRIEDVLILKEGGCEDITRSPKDLIVL